jgi:hypothetical protein
MTNTLGLLDDSRLKAQIQDQMLLRCIHQLQQLPLLGVSNLEAMFLKYTPSLTTTSGSSYLHTSFCERSSK